MFYTDLEVNDSVKVGEIIVTLVSKPGKFMKVGIKAPKDIKIEVCKKKATQKQ